MWKVTLQGLAAHKIRMLATSLAVVLGVAFMAGTLVLTDTLGNVFDDLFTQTTKGVDVAVRTRQPFTTTDSDAGGDQLREPVAANVADVVATADGVDTVAGSLRGFALVQDRAGDPIVGQAPTLGISWSDEPKFSQAMQLESGNRPRAPDEVALDVKTARAAGAEVGDTVRISFLSAPTQTFTVVGTYLFGGTEAGLAGATLAAFEPGTAQQLMNRVGSWDRLDVSASQGVSQEELAASIDRTLRTAGLAGDYETITGADLAAEESGSVQSEFAFFRTGLLGFAFVALFVGAFIISNTFSIVVAQRGRELGLLRALGATGSQVRRSVALEAVIVGAVSAAVGLALGIGFAIGLQSLMRALGLDLPTGPTQVLPRTVIVALLVGTGVTLVSALAPARRAARIAPIAALGESEALPAGTGRRRAGLGAGLVVVAGALLAYGLAPDTSDPAVVVGVAAGVAFAAVILLSPLLARPVARMVGWLPARIGGVSGRLARENAARNPRRTASTAAALMIGLTLVTFVAVFGASAKQGFAEILDDGVRAELVVSGAGFSSVSPDAADALRDALPEATVVEIRLGEAEIAGATREVSSVGAGFEDAYSIPFARGARLDRFESSGGILVADDVARTNKWVVGDTIDVRFARTGVVPLVVQGIYTSTDVVQADFALALRDHEANFTDQADAQIAVKLTGGADVAASVTAGERAVEAFPNVVVEDRDEFRDTQTAPFDQLLNLMYVLLLLAVVIALVGIVNTLALSIHERTHEIGLLRAVGMTRRQTRRMVRSEAVIIAVFGTLLGLALGVGFGRAMVAALSAEGLVFVLPGTQLVVFVVLAVVAGFGAGWFPARRAAKLDVLDAISRP
jgi:putative ABC transport system permease protein